MQNVQRARQELASLFDTSHMRNKLLFGSYIADLIKQRRDAHKETQELFKVDPSVFNSYDTLRAKIKTLSNETITQNTQKPLPCPA